MARKKKPATMSPKPDNKIVFTIKGEYDANKVGASDAMSNLEEALYALRCYGTAECDVQISAGKLRLP